jgi:DNA-binding NarL/FixJ family response regulator
MRTIVDLALGDGSVVAQAHDRTGALQEIESKSANAVVLEMGLPDGQGGEIIASLRAAHPNLVIMVCTFVDDAASHRQAELAGADIYLVKPVSMRQIRTITGLIADRSGLASVPP